MHLTSDKLQRCINSMKQIHLKAKVSLITNRIYKFGDLYIVYNKAQRPLVIDLESPIESVYSSQTFTILKNKPILVSIIEIKICEVGTLPKQVTDKIFDSEILELPNTLCAELNNSNRKINDPEFLFSYPIVVGSDHIEFKQEGNNVIICFNHDHIRTILNAKIDGNEILCNSWSSVDTIIREASRKITDIMSMSNHVENKQLWDSYEDIKDNIHHYHANLDKRKLSQALDKIIKDIQCGKFKKV